MARCLLLDIGAGTMDILYYNTNKKTFYKAVVLSPTKYLAKKIDLFSRDLLVTGCEMGGGAVSIALKNLAKIRKVYMTKESAPTISHDFDKVKKMNIKILDDNEINKYKKRTDFLNIELTDIQIDRIKKIVLSFGVPFSFDIIAVCAQDHGSPNKKFSQLDFRHKMFVKLLGKKPLFSNLLYSSNTVPAVMSRFSSIVKKLSEFSTNKIYIMDSGMAAIFGASLDFNSLYKKKKIVLDIANSHTVVAAMKDSILCSFFEYHTSDITLEKLITLIKLLPEGKISHDKIVKDGGHGAYINTKFNYNSLDGIVVTGPMRRMIKDIRIPVIFGSPWGDNMMSGITGLMELIRIKEGFSKIDYI